ncbi:histamine H2 receptor-like [Tubulanus polymorphus]|uniref:histamine H2 receptor-like n=1 Tax=Tubulanus polymorphus TaxID=672921 RepID=UPI003DA2399C
MENSSTKLLLANETLSPPNSIDTQSNKRTVYDIAIYGVFLFVIMMFSMFGNIFVIIVTFRTPKLSAQIANMFLINLAVTDLSNSALVMLPSFVALIQDKWMLTFAICQLQCSLNYVFIIVSMLTLAFISIDRYVAIVHSLRYPVLMKKSYVIGLIVYTWFQGVLFAIAPVIADWVHFDYWEIVCAIDWFVKSNGIIVYVIVANLLCFMAPGAIMVFTYYKIIAVTKKLKSQVFDVRTKQMKRSLTASKTITSLIVVVVVFFICMTPFCLTKLFKSIFRTNLNAVPPHLNTVSALIQYTASATNPLIYGIFRKDFRAAFIKQLQKIGLCKTLTPDDDSFPYASSSAHMNRIGNIGRGIEASGHIESVNPSECVVVTADRKIFQETPRDRNGNSDHSPVISDGIISGSEILSSSPKK